MPSVRTSGGSSFFFSRRHKGSKMKKLLILLLISLPVFLVGCLEEAGTGVGGAGEPVSFSQDVYPILDFRCSSCHNPIIRDGRLDVTSYATLMTGGISGPCVIPFDPDRSLLVRYVEDPADITHYSLFDAVELQTVRAWIQQGALNN
jgi:hypothetical protein